MTKKMQWFGPREQKREPSTPRFGIILQGKGQFATCYLYRNKIAGIITADPKELWESISGWESPKLWYTYDLNDLFYNLVLEILPPDKLTEKVVNSKAKEVEKMVIIPYGGSDTLKLVIRQEKRHPRSKRLDDISIINASSYYDHGPEGLADDFESPYGRKTFNDLAISVWYGIGCIHAWTVANLKVKLGGSWGSTVFKSLESHFVEDSVPKLPREVEDFIQPAFMGGKTELYKIMQPDVKCYDNNGLYGAAYSLELPMKNRYHEENMTPEALLNTKHLGFIDWDFYVPEYLPNGELRERGPLPVRDDKLGLIYPVGHVKSTKTNPVRHFTPLVEEAVKNHGVIIEKIHYGIFFKISKQFLRSWAEHTAALKLSAKNRGERKLASSSMQLVYGKFAQKEVRQLVHIGSIPKEKRTDPNVSIISDDLPIWYETIERRLSNRLPHVASAITGWAHVIMLRDFDRIEQFGREICYTDTDSLFVDGYIPKDMVGTTLGTYRLEHDHVDFIGFAPKFYYLVKRGKIIARAKGISGYTPKAQDIEDLIKGKKLRFEWDRPPTILESIVMKYHYERAPELFKATLKAFPPKERRTFPGTKRETISVLDFDIKRRQLSLTKSRPLNMSEVR